MWILLGVGVCVFLAIRYSGWWISIPIVLFLALTATCIIGGRVDKKHKTEQLKVLSYPLYGLYHMDRIEQSAEGGYSYDIVPDFKSYKPQLQQEILKAMHGALSDPDIDFSEILPNLPFDDAEIKMHLSVTLKRLADR